ncbi:hypothetical protein C1I98_03525 [Spongiactinospora gelatinilytica]|uniref:Uncharacterized protein n=1 Tax=Spongiactinospora gelatinilytica TaxID=2666298 RepID=A0A2W2HY04_9ACTN|nr:hypothetical protein [Spongiactinospora gelatinilytica]PZG55500.1 hypothetical protein C1I98_03525 [Spongiactinospora gelatinilytica]
MPEREVRGYRTVALPRNAPRSILDDGESCPLGERTLHGIPFDFGEERGDAALLRVESEAVTIPLGRSFRSRWTAARRPTSTAGPVAPARTCPGGERRSRRSTARTYGWPRPRRPG